MKNRTTPSILGPHDRFGHRRRAKVLVRLVVVLVVLALLVAVLIGSFTGRRPVRVGAKVFTESVILAEIGTQLMRDAGARAEFGDPLGGTSICFKALQTGDIDAYPEYTGTIEQEILAGQHITGEANLRQALREQGIGMTAPLGFNNTYALGMPEALAQKLGISKISQLRDHPELTFGFSNEFLDRKDGWPALRDRYHLPQTKVNGLDHDLAYRALSSGAISLTDLYSTDAEIAYYKLRVLEDDLHLFPRYDAVYLYRLDLADRAPEAVAALKKLQGRINERTMIRLNARAKLDRVQEQLVAGDFIESQFDVRSDAEGITLWARLWRRTKEHLLLVSVSLALAIAVGVPLGIVAAGRRIAGQGILGSVAVIYTIPSLALLVFMIPLMHALGLPALGNGPAIVALFLYSLLPIVRNTHAGLTTIPSHLRESAAALGLPRWARLWQIELPLAAQSILAGIKTAAVLNVGMATLGALINAGGYGQPIFAGVRLDDTKLILLGAIPAAVLALLVQGVFELIERWIVPRGLRLRPAE